MLHVNTKGYLRTMRNQKKHLLLVLMTVGENRDDFKTVVTFELSLENLRIRKFRDERIRAVQAEKIMRVKL